MSRSVRFVGLLLAVGLVVGACGGTAGETSSTPAEPTAEAGRGEIVLAVEQWPECLNPITSCANATWLSWSVLVHVQPGLLEFDPDNVLRASPVVEEMPTTENGGVVVHGEGSFTVTYRIDPEARWSDGTPITSNDVWFTWRAILDTQGSLQTIGYDLVAAVDTDDPQTAVISFSKPYAPWPYMFHNLLPAHAFDGNTDISGHWNDAIPISGGPWLQESWSQEQQILVPNENYWVPERMPQVDRVVMVPREDTDSEVVALQTGEVMAAMPQPFPGAKDRLVGDLTFISGPSTFIEGLWFNQLAPDRRFEISTNVRKAVAYALDRDRIAEVALGSIMDETVVLQCAGWNPALGNWCGDDFIRYRQDMDAVAELLAADGWTRPDPDGLWVNADGEELVIQWNTVAGNKRREDVQALVTEMSAPFGIGWEIINYDAGELFQNRLPAMNTGPLVLYAAETIPDPSVSRMYDMDGIPSEANGFSGQNFMAYASQAATDLAFAIDEEIDPAARFELVAELGELLAEDVPWIPLYVLPNLLVWNTSLVEGPGEWVSSVYGGFYDIYDWTPAG